MSRLHDATLDLLWSVWSELGIPGRERRHQAVAIDPEPLIAWTPFLAASEPRLLGLAFDWCVAHSAQVAGTRFTGLARQMPAGTVAALAAFNGALAPHGIDWRPRGPRAERAVGRAKLALPRDRPALVRLRLRALCGVSARAEVMAGLLAAGTRPALVAELTPAGFTRRSVERVLGDLAEAGLVAVEGGERRRSFRLIQHRAVESLVRGEGLRWIDWHTALSLAGALGELAGHGKKSPGLLRVEAARSWAQLSHLGLSLGLEPPPGSPERSDSFAALLEWGTRAMERM